MHYKFNPFTGRLSTPSTVEVRNKYAQYGEAPTQVFILNTKLSGTDHPTYRGKYAPLSQALKNKMRLFQAANGLPVHIKAGRWTRYSSPSPPACVWWASWTASRSTTSSPTPPRRPPSNNTAASDAPHDESLKQRRDFQFMHV
ncbi:uncharacterized protein LOC123520659 [Portunus trituberculatus]|uniref:uncharacterized protein LOC123520659 n=1 Tax=Portunus trituberculatus TaxID=210409 RepID=UPI001E1CDCEB|nr:uncharacterized protein LOC123520659 [Portunus trituberculatus]